MITSWAGKRVTVVGLGRFGGGAGAARWLAGQGAGVTVSDCAPADDLAESVVGLSGLAIDLHLGDHLRSDFLETDLLVVNPAVPPQMPLLVEAAEAHVPQTTAVNLFLERCPAPVVGITGSVGKSTTTAMTGEVLSRRFTTHVGGNIGGSLLELLGDIQADHVVVLELSSFQLERIEPVGISPHVAVVTNLRPNHLDRHGTMDAYAAAKRKIFAFQKADDVLVLNAAEPATADWHGPGRTVTFNPAAAPFELPVPGRHNQANAQAAWAVAEVLGVEREAAAEALGAFAGLPHRLEFVAERGGVRFYNDSKCTTPEGAIVALEAFEPRQVVIIVGGYDKQVSFDALGKALGDRAKAVVVMGATSEQIAAAVEAHRSGEAPRMTLASDLSYAVEAAKRQAGVGDVVLLSPACASYDMFTNYEERGRAFAELVTTG